MSLKLGLLVELLVDLLIEKTLNTGIRLKEIMDLNR